MRDLRIICRAELLATMRDEYDRLLDEAVNLAKLGCEEGMTHDRGIEVMCLLREAYAVDLLRDEIAQDTKHAPSAQATGGEHDRSMTEHDA